MTRLHYGPTLDIELDPDSIRQVTEAIGAHATRGGWITFSDRADRQWTILITPGIAIWLEPGTDEPKTGSAPAH